MCCIHLPLLSALCCVHFSFFPHSNSPLSHPAGVGVGVGGWGESLTVNQAFSVRPSKKLTSLQMSRSSRMNVSKRVKLSLSHKKLKY